MSILQIAARDMRDRSRFLLLAAALAPLPFLIAIVPGITARLDAIAVTGAILSLALGLGTAVIFGVSTISSELAEKRLSFWFTRPISAASIWFGKLTAAVAMSFACFTIIAVPAMLLSADRWRAHPVEQPWQVFAFALAAIAVLFVVSHTVSSILRSHSWFLAVDIAMAVIATVALFLITRPLLLNADSKPLFLFAIGIALVMFIAPIRQLAAGRTDVRRSHRALSITLWSGIAIVLVLAATWTSWRVVAKPSDLKITQVMQNADGSAYFLVGYSPRQPKTVATFLVDAKSGHSERVAFSHTMHFSRNGRVAGWIEPRFTGGSQLMIHDFDSGRTIATGLTATDNNGIVFSDDGARVVIREHERLTVYDVASRRLVASMKFAPMSVLTIFFRDNDTLHLTGGANGLLTVRELDLSTERETQLVKQQMRASYPLSISNDASRILIDGTREILDGRTGAVLAQLPRSEHPLMASMLGDGTVATLDRPDREIKLRLYSRDGVAQHELTLPSQNAWLIGERRKNTLIVIGYDHADRATREGRTLYVINLETGAIVESQRGESRPTPGILRNGLDPRFPRYESVANVSNGEHS